MKFWGQLGFVDTTHSLALQLFLFCLYFTMEGVYKPWLSQILHSIFQKSYFRGHFEVSEKVAHFDLTILKPSVFSEIELWASFENTFRPLALADVPNLTFLEKNSE